MIKTYLLTICYFSFLIIFSAYLSERFVVNKTDSLPGLVYIREKSLNIERGDTVLVCNSDKVASFAQKLRITSANTNICKTGTPLIKLVIAVPFDHIEATGIEDLLVNGRKITGSTPLTESILPRFISNRRLTGEEYLIFSPHSLSFDSRYFGVVKSKQIKAKLRLMF